MSFDAILNEIVTSCPGCQGVALMGSDGIPIAQTVAGGGADLDDVVSVMGIEFGRILDESRKAADSVEGGGLEELLVRMGTTQVALRIVDAETYLVMVLTGSGNAGKGRFLMRRHLNALREQL